MLRNDSAKASLGSADRAIDERQFGDVVLVDHGKNWLLLVYVHLGVAVFELVSGRELAEAIVRNEATGFLFGLAIEGAQRGRHTGGIEATNIGFLFAFLKLVRSNWRYDFDIRLSLVELFLRKAVFVPVF